jgi:hypothetical protein
MNTHDFNEQFEDFIQITQQNKFLIQFLSHRKISLPLKRPASQGLYFMKEAYDLRKYTVWTE